MVGATGGGGLLLDLVYCPAKACFDGYLKILSYV